eukprot:GDKH01002367.1.p2 GENE.GDKH01002367.1~~GDKH01002367.1.p2  ORF type:complete len:50 (-),score=6.99 GDKH01002367.1:238-387(-)
MGVGAAERSSVDRAAEAMAVPRAGRLVARGVLGGVLSGALGGVLGHSVN